MTLSRCLRATLAPPISPQPSMTSANPVSCQLIGKFFLNNKRSLPEDPLTLYYDAFFGCSQPTASCPLCIGSFRWYIGSRDPNVYPDGLYHLSAKVRPPFFHTIPPFSHLFRWFPFGLTETPLVPIMTVYTY